jgi:hypothetical protein
VLTPQTAILSGGIEKGSIKFHVDNVIDSGGTGCTPTSFTLTPFGTIQLVAEWQEQGCPGGHVLLQKTRQ